MIPEYVNDPNYIVLEEQCYHLLGIAADDEGCNTRNVQDPLHNVLEEPDPSKQ